jgi:hypothetical protein
MICTTFALRSVSTKPCGERIETRSDDNGGDAEHPRH